MLASKWRNFIAETLANNPDLVADTIRGISDGLKARLSQECGKRAEAETALVLAFNHMEKTDDAKNRPEWETRVRQALKESNCWKGTKFADEL